jgi:hypothetical protein
MQKTGLTLLKARSYDGYSIIKSFKEESGIQLPPIFSAFVETFEVGKDKLFFEKLILPGDNGFLDLETHRFVDDNQVVLYHFLSLEDSLKFMNEVYSDEDEINALKYFLIGEGGFSYWFLVGLEGEMQDKILLDTFVGEPRFTVIAENIFEFLSKIKIEEMEEDSLIRLGYKFSDLYKKWGEDFWRAHQNDKI